MRRAAAVIAVALLIAVAFFTFKDRSRSQAPQPPGAKEPGIQQPAPGQQPEPGGGGQKSSTVVKPGNYFPLTPGSWWQYLGEGNEYATFKREVLYVKNDRAQIKEDNGGTVSAAVFKITDDAVTRILFEGEQYENTNLLDQAPRENVVILKAPLAAGTRWETPNGPREIVDVNATVDTPAGKFADCLKIKIEGAGSTIYEYYKEGVGMVKREFVSGDIRVTSTLESYKINER
ncbi:MAG: hypothetical protein AB2448_13120 [Moorella sp. (in: firmicutes)]